LLLLLLAAVGEWRSLSQALLCEEDERRGMGANG